MDLILPDVNVLVYAFQVDAPQHREYRRWLTEMGTAAQLALPDEVSLGTLRVLSDPRIYPRPARADDVLGFIDALRATPRARSIASTRATWRCLHGLVAGDVGVRGKLVPDAWLAALAISHGARLATADRGFARFAGLDWFVPVEI